MILLTVSLMALSRTQDNFDLMFVYKHLEFLFGVSDSWAGFFFFFLFFNCHLVTVQSLSHVQLFVTPCTAAHQSSWPSLSPGVCANHVHWVSDAIQPSHPLVVPFSSCLQSFPASRSFPNESAPGIKWPKFWSFGISPIFQWIFSCHLSHFKVYSSVSLNTSCATITTIHPQSSFYLTKLKLGNH